MPIVRINAQEGRPVAAEGGSARAALAAALTDHAPGAPVVVMIHGYKHTPSVPGHSPHNHILALRPTRGGRSLSWPRHLGFGRGDAGEGLAIAFGWEARGSIWQAYREAERAGRALAEVIRLVRASHSGRVDVIAHSLGARVALQAMRELPPASLGRAILLSGAEFQDEAVRALASPAGRTAEVLNVTSGENRIFDLMFERLLQAPISSGRAIGVGLPDPVARWTDLRIDCAATRAHLSNLGFRIAAPANYICHWSGYMRPGLFPIYTAVLRDRTAWPPRRLVPPAPLGVTFPSAVPA